MKILMIAFCVIMTASGCKDASVPKGKTTSTRIYSDEDKMYLTLLNASGTQLYPNEYSPAEDYSLVILDYREGNSKEVLIAVSLGCTRDRTVRTAKGIGACLALLSTIRSESTIRIYDQCCVPASWEAPDSHREKIGNALDGMDLDMESMYLFDSCYQEP